MYSNWSKIPVPFTENRVITEFSFPNLLIGYSQAYKSLLNKYTLYFVTRLLRKGNYAERVGAGAPVYMAAVMEYLAAEVCPPSPCPSHPF